MMSAAGLMLALARTRAPPARAPMHVYACARVSASMPLLAPASRPKARMLSSSIATIATVPHASALVPRHRHPSCSSASTPITTITPMYSRTLAPLLLVRRRFASSSSPPLMPPLSSQQAQPPATPAPPPITWIDRHVPRAWHPYAHLARIDKPIGTWLLLWPCLWSTALAAPPGHLPDLKYLALFTAGAFIMRGAGCTINDMWDRRFDARVARTVTRPLASGAVTMPRAAAFLLFQLSLGLGVVTQLDLHTLVLSFCSIPLVIVYPLMKRYTNWPQLVLGLTFNWGALVGYPAAAAVAGTFPPALLLPLYASGVCWTLVYDTIYAHQDTVDDAKLGLRSTALHFGDASMRYLSTFAALSVALLALTGVAAQASAPFFVLGVGGTAAHYAYQLRTVRLHDRASCMRTFVSNKWFGAIVFVAIVVDRLCASAEGTGGVEATDDAAKSPVAAAADVSSPCDRRA